MRVFLGRTEEQERFRAVLAELVRGGGPDEGYVVLVQGLGGIGKSTLLHRYRQIAAEGVPSDLRGGKQEFLIAVVDWEDEQRQRATDYLSEGGPPIWVVLDRVYKAVLDAAAASRRDAAAVDKAFAPFRVQVTKVPELAEEVRRVLPGDDEHERRTSAADIEAVLQAVGRGAFILGGAHPVGAVGAVVAEPVTKSAVHLAQDAREAVKEWRHGQVPEEAYRLVLRQVEALVETFAQCLRHVSAKVRPVIVALDTCELILGSQEYLRRAMRRAAHGRRG